MLDSDLGAALLPDAPPIKACVICGRRFYTRMGRPVCLDCRCPAAAVRRRPALGQVLAVLRVLFDG